MNARIVGIDHALPDRVVTNEELATRHPEWRMPLVERRTGVRERRIAGPDETALDLSARAARTLLDRVGADPSGIDALLVCTQTPDRPMPPNATLLQDRLGLARSVAALDFTLACSGFVYGLYLSKALITAGQATSVLLITGDTYSTLIDPDDRGTMTLFGDGAAATLIGRTDGPGIGEFALGTDGGDAQCFTVPAGGARLPSSEATRLRTADRNGNVRSQEKIHMDGGAVLAFVQREVPRNVEDALRRNGRTMADVELVVFHQASAVALDWLERACGIPPGRSFRDMETIGNLVSASIPVALRNAELAGRLRPGARVLLSSFGVGLSWGSCVLTW